MRIVLLGPPGSGKAHLSTHIGEYCKVPVVTCNGVLARAAAEESELGRLAKEAMDTSRVSDELLLALLRVRLTQPDLADGFVLVDFPRTAGQADVLDSILDSLGRPLDLVLYLTVDPDELMERLVGRITCDQCGAQYNLYVNPPIVEGVCDECGARVSQRPDDYEETISNRLRIYETQTSPLTQYFALHGKLRNVSGDADEATVWTAVKKIIDATPRTVLETEPVSEPPVSIDRDQAGAPAEKPAPRPAKKAQKTQQGVAARAAPTGATKPAKRAAGKATSAKAAAKQAAAKKPAVKKAAKKAAPKKAAVRQAMAEKAGSKKAAVKKASGKKAAVKKAAVKKAAAKKTVKKPPVKKKATARQPAAKRAAARKPATKKAAAPKKAAPKQKAAAKKAAPKHQAVAKKAPVKKAPAGKKAPANKAKKPTARKAAAKQSAAKKGAAAKRRR